MNPAVAGNQATWVADASNLSDISGSRIPNDQVQPPMIAKLTTKQPTDRSTVIDVSFVMSKMGARHNICYFNAADEKRSDFYND